MACFTVSGCLSQGVTNPRNRVAEFVNTSGKRDKLVKVALATSNLAGFVAGKAGAREVAERFESASWGLGYARDVFGFFNVFGGVVPAMVGDARKISTATSSIFTGEAYTVRGVEHETPVEKGLALAKHASSFVSGTAFFGAFGVCRPARLVTNSCKLHDMRLGNVPDPRPCGESAHALGSAFGSFMFVNHAASVLGSLAGMVLEGIFCARGKNYFSDEQRQTFFEFVEHIWGHIVKFVEKALEIVVDISTVFKVAMPPALTLSFTFVASLLSLYSLWKDTPAG